jgi:hypothetical protein
MLNPGLGPWDYYGEHEVPDYCQALLANLRQELRARPYPFLFLDPQFGWHGGYTWWYGKFAGIIEALAQRWDSSIADAPRALSNEIASVELFPYHSASFRDADGWLRVRRRLQSVALAHAFVNETVLPRVSRGDAIVIVARRVRDWALSPAPGIILYTSSQARAAHITPNSSGGKAVLDLFSQTRLDDRRVIRRDSLVT